jgi:hypothetical protein
MPEGRRLCGVEVAGGRAGKAVGRRLIRSLGREPTCARRKGANLADMGVDPVTGTAMQQACALAAYLETHARRRLRCWARGREERVVGSRVAAKPTHFV